MRKMQKVSEIRREFKNNARIEPHLAQRHM